MPPQKRPIALSSEFATYLLQWGCTIFAVDQEIFCISLGGKVLLQLPMLRSKLGRRLLDL